MFDLISNIYLQTLLAFGMGLYAALICRLSFRPSSSLLFSSILLPPVVCTALLAVNGSIGTSIAVLGVFGLVRFRSLPGSSSDLVCVLYAMVLGLLCASGAWLATLLLGGLLGLLILAASYFQRRNLQEMEIVIVVPESMNDEWEYRELLENVGRDVRLERMRTAGMGTLYELTYRFIAKPNLQAASLLDAIRAKNGNLNVTLIELHENAGQL